MQCDGIISKLKILHIYRIYKNKKKRVERLMFYTLKMRLIIIFF